MESQLGGMSFADGPDDPPPPVEAPFPDPGEDFGHGSGGHGSGSHGGQGFGGQGNGRFRKQNNRQNQYQDLGREMPQNVAAEQGVLGGMLMNKDAISEVVEILVMDDFYRPAHQTIFDVIVRLYGEGKEVDPVIVAGRLDRDGKIE